MDMQKANAIANFLIKIRRELRAARYARLAENREERSAERHKKYFGRNIE